MSLAHSFAIIDALMAVLDEDTAQAVIEHRRAKKCPLTLKAAELLAKQFALCRDPQEAAEEMIIRGWRGFKAEWVPEICKPVERPKILNPVFDQLWQSYPVQDVEDYMGALAAFTSVPDEDYDLVLKAAAWLNGGLPPKFDPTYRERAKFIPSLKKWLLERRYESKRAIWSQSLNRKQG